ncbi:YpdA family putative bacillithiol disulfide reductase [Croceimicrobium sp.]|uniref:YpdA family putative bacillithiol disulfide reductase n=1 Tax=Croceimicrobium sp. TaxID=2828340 RepID=UPI003BAB8FCE
MYDLIIVGGGPIGMACGIAAQEAGINYLIIEKGYLVNSLYHYPHSMTFFSTADKLEIGGIPFISQNTKPTRSEALEYYRRVCMKHQLHIHLQERLVDVLSSKAGFSITTDKDSYQSQYLILATGFYDLVNPLNIPGEDLPKVAHYYKDPHPYFGQRVAVVGAANSAVDAALELYRKGAKEVTMIIRESEISPRVKYWVRPDVINRIEEGSIKAYFEAELSAIHDDHIVFEHQGQSKEIANDAVLALTGYRPDFKMLENIGLEFSEEASHKPLYDEDTMESSVSNLFLAGVICGGLETNKWFIENSRVHADKIIGEVKRRMGF